MQFLFQQDGIAWKLLREDPDRYIYEPVLKGIDLQLPEEIEAGINDVSKRDGWNKPAREEYALSTETWREHVARRQRCLELRQKISDGEIKSANDLITYNLNMRQLAQDVIENCYDPELVWAFYQAITKITILDPTCGSGAFLFSALNILEPLYEACLEQMQIFLDEGFVPANKNAAKILNNFYHVIEQINLHHNRRYFILKTIIINNLYGVDIMPEATEICKLRLYLKLASQVTTDFSKFNNGIEPLPDIDFNIRAGNTLVGFVNYNEVKKAVEGEQQKKLDLFNDMGKIDDKAQRVDQAFQYFRELQTQKIVNGDVIAQSKAELRSNLQELRGELDHYLADEYETGQSKKLVAFKKWKESHQPFHWFVEFYSIIKRGGFDVIIGNPPYVEYSKVHNQYKIKNFITQDCGDLYAFVMERSINILIKNGGMGMIVPVSIVSTDGFSKLRSFMRQGKRISWSLSFAERPSKLFTGVEKRLTIWLTRQFTHPKNLLLSNYRRWLAEERDILFSKTTFIPENAESNLVGTAIPKVLSTVELLILSRLNQHLKLNQFFLKSSQHIVYYTRKLRYFVQFFESVPKIRDKNGNLVEPSELKRIYLGSEAHKNTIISILNSSLFFWFFNVFSDVRNVNRREIDSFRCSLDLMEDHLVNKLQDLSKQLMDDFENNSKFLTNNYGKFGTLTIQSFQPRLSKPIIDKIDSVLAQHYGFTEEELDFIINYDIKYRMGKDSEDDSE